MSVADVGAGAFGKVCDEPLWRQLKAAPLTGGREAPNPVYADFLDVVAKSDVNPDPEHLLENQAVQRLLEGIGAGSPYLMNLIRCDAARFIRLLATQPDAQFTSLQTALSAEMQAAENLQDAMAAMRRFKTEMALLIGLCDLGGVWPVMKVTDVLTRTADTALHVAVNFLFRQEAAKGRWRPVDERRPEHGSGYIVLAMGKHGAFELNYSSDIDLIIFFDKATAKPLLGDDVEIQPFFVRLTRDLVKLMMERTQDGYVFRTDLRLRPDAGATQIALSTDAGFAYYESFGQNWERAAMIKARAAAGDLEAGESFLQQLRAFIWRKYLDFAAIADVHAMKRQIHAFRGFGEVVVQGHNIKVGRGGIREIEFFVQTQQLIAGGRQPALRDRRTLVTLRQLADSNWIEDAVCEELTEAYCFLRMIEHRIQMVADEQTQELPSDPDRFLSLARFSGYPTADAFSDAILHTLETVQRHYIALFEDAPTLTSGQENLVFTGQDDDPETVSLLKRMGFSQPAAVIATVRAWHSGRYAAVRSPRSRERLTEVQPILIDALSKTAEPDAALASFDRFLSELPTGIQLFALLSANPALLRLVADIMGTAPRLSQILSRRRRLLDAVIDPRTFEVLPDRDELDELLSAELGRGADLQEKLDRARVVGSEQSFLIGIRVLSGTINASQAGGAYALLAERLVIALLGCVEVELARVHGRVPGGQAGVIAMGKLGGCELSASSDLDLILVYDHDPDVTGSDGDKPLAPSQYYARLTQRLISALSAPTAEGVLYEVDMRLRPSGQQGPVATRLSSFVRYQAEEAWTWEHMALTRARVIAGPEVLKAQVEAAIGSALVSQRDREKIAVDVRDMRERIFAEKGSISVWDLKNVRGGLIDLEFIAQFLQLVHAHVRPDILRTNTREAIRTMCENGFVGSRDGELLMGATQLFHDVTQVLKICVAEGFKPETASEGLKGLAARAGGQPDLPALERILEETTSGVAAAFDRIVV